ncbi:MAG TPA: YncE family protein [Candidatus Acidoferrum sp.]|nr:YncE family protein [Candidatus Acidoferrum sp.]
MNNIFAVYLALILMFGFTTKVGAQNNSTTPKSGAASGQNSEAPERDAPLVLTEAIPTENAKGRFDHFANGKGRLFVSALGSNAVEIINIGGRILEHTISGIPYPQGVAFSPEANKLFAASGGGKVYIYDGTTYDLITTVDFEGGADNLRYDAANKRVYVACGDDEKTGAIATIDATTNQRLDEEYKLGGEPESFQLEKSGPNIYVNVPPLKQIVVINRATKEIKRWDLKGVEENFPMALDEADHRLFVGVHVPPRLLAFDTTSGRMVATLRSVQDMDDLYFDADRKRIYMPGGEGYIDVFQMTGPDHYRLLTKIPTALGARTAGYFGKGSKGFDRFYLAVPARGGQSAEVRIYTVQD